MNKFKLVQIFTVSINIVRTEKHSSRALRVLSIQLNSPRLL